MKKTFLQLLFVLAFCSVVVVIVWNYSLGGVQQIVLQPLGNQNVQAAGQPDSVVGDSDISASFIDSVLAQAHSPAVGIGQEMYQDGVDAHIKPSFALSVFHMESRYGTMGVATANHSIGNIRSGSGYKWYPSWADSVRDFYQLLQTRYVGQGLTTVAQIIPVYAPRSDGNNPDRYIQAVRGDMTGWQKQG